MTHLEKREFMEKKLRYESNLYEMQRESACVTDIFLLNIRRDNVA